MEIKAFKCDECGQLVEKADNLMVLERCGSSVDKTYVMECRFYKKKNPAQETENGKAVDLCERCKKYISGTGELEGEFKKGVV